MGWESRTHPFKQIQLFRDMETQGAGPGELRQRLGDPSVRAVSTAIPPQHDSQGRCLRDWLWLQEMLAQAEALAHEDSLAGRMYKMMYV